MVLKCDQQDISKTERKIRDQRKDEICEEFRGQLKSTFSMELSRILCPTNLLVQKCTRVYGGPCESGII